MLGSGDTFVVEADEFNRTFLQLSPTIAVINNIDLEHIDCYKDIDDLKDAFTEFANSVPFYGMVSICKDSENAAAIIPLIDKPIVTYGIGLEHRFEMFKEVDNIKFINDSKSTNIASVKVAVESIDKNIILIMGGLPKESDFSAIIEYTQSVKSIIAYGVGSNDIYNSLSDSYDVIKINKFEKAITS